MALFESLENILRHDHDITGPKSAGAIVGVSLLSENVRPVPLKQSYDLYKSSWKRGFIYGMRQRKRKEGDIEKFERDLEGLQTFSTMKPWELTGEELHHTLYAEIRGLLSAMQEMSPSLPNEFIDYRFHEASMIARRARKGLGRVIGGGKVEELAKDYGYETRKVLGAKGEERRRQHAQKMIESHGKDIFYEIDLSRWASASLLHTVMDVYGFKELAELVQKGSGYFQETRPRMEQNTNNGAI